MLRRPVKYYRSLLASIFIVCSISALAQKPSLAQSSSDVIVIAAFDGSDYEGWRPEGTAFGEAPSGGKNGHYMPGYLGGQFATSLSENETATGTLTSPNFEIKRNSIHFLLGADEIFFLPNLAQYGNLAVQLIIDGEVERMTVPRKFHSMFWESWNVSEFKGRSAQIKIIDNDKRKWAHIDVDHIIQSNVPAGGSIISRRIKVDQPLLNFPIEEKGIRQYVELFVDGKAVRGFDAALGTDKINYWAITDVSEWIGKEMTIRTRQFYGSPKVLDKISAEDGIIDAYDLYVEPLRSQFHFSSKRGWLNDPNGLVYYNGEYHLYYQHNPFGCDFSRNDYSKSWGHAVSTDLVHWKELPDAIYPDSLGSIYSGSAVVDEFNSAGFQSEKEKTIVAMFTSAGNRNPWSAGKPFTQSIAFSNDRGRTFTKYKGNPVLENLEYVNRDPKIFWYEPTKCWVLVLHFDERAMAFFNSRDLKNWKFQSELGIKYLIDCPELFPLPIDGNEAEQKWILYGGPGYYYVGEFDGKEFKPETDEIKYNYGNCFYASQTFNSVPETIGRRIQIAWGTVDTPDMPFNQIMDFPVELTLHNTDDGLRMFSYPVKEIENIYEEKYEWKDVDIQPGKNLLEKVEGELFDIDAKFIVGKTGKFGFGINGASVVYDVDRSELSCGGKKALLNPEKGIIALRILTDRVSIEIFANGGRIYMPIGAHFDKDRKGLGIFSSINNLTIKSLIIHKIRSIWDLSK